MNKTPEEEYRVVSVKKGRKGKTSAKSISLSLAEGVNMGGQGYREVESLPEVSKVEDGVFYVLPDGTVNYVQDGEWKAISGGGGASYTAGEGIQIQSNTISVDETVASKDYVQEYLEPIWEVELSYYPEWAEEWGYEWGDGCTINSIDQEKLSAFVEEHGGRDNINFDYQEGWDPETGEPTGEHYWMFWGMGDRVVIYPDEMLEVTGIDVAIDEGSDWAMFSVRFNLSVNTHTDTVSAKINIPLKNLCFTSENDHITIEDKEVPCQALCSMYSIYRGNSQGYTSETIPDYFLAWCHNLTSWYTLLSEAGNYCCWQTRVSSSSNLRKVGNNCFSAYFEGPDEEIHFSSANLLEECGDDCFSDYLVTVGFQNLTKIGRSCFRSCTMCQTRYTNTFPVLVEAGDGSFDAISLKNTLTFPGLEKVGDYCFMNLHGNGHSVNLPVLASAKSSFFSNAENFQISVPNLETLGSGSFSDCKWDSYVSINLPKLKNLSGPYTLARLNTPSLQVYLPSLANDGITGGLEGMLDGCVGGDNPDYRVFSGASLLAYSNWGWGDSVEPLYSSVGIQLVCPGSYDLESTKESRSRKIVSAGQGGSTITDIAKYNTDNYPSLPAGIYMGFAHMKDQDDEFDLDGGVFARLSNTYVRNVHNGIEYRNAGGSRWTKIEPSPTIATITCWKTDDPVEQDWKVTLQNNCSVTIEDTQKLRNTPVCLYYLLNNTWYTIDGGGYICPTSLPDGLSVQLEEGATTASFVVRMDYLWTSTNYTMETYSCTKESELNTLPGYAIIGGQLVSSNKIAKIETDLTVLPRGFGSNLSSYATISAPHATMAGDWCFFGRGPNHGAPMTVGDYCYWAISVDGSILSNVRFAGAYFCNYSELRSTVNTDSLESVGRHAFDGSFGSLVLSSLRHAGTGFGSHGNFGKVSLKALTYLGGNAFADATIDQLHLGDLTGLGFTTGDGGSNTLNKIKRLNALFVGNCSPFLDRYGLTTTDPQSSLYTRGVQVIGEASQAWLDAYPNLDGVDGLYRKLFVY